MQLQVIYNLVDALLYARLHSIEKMNLISYFIKIFIVLPIIFNLYLNEVCHNFWAPLHDVSEPSAAFVARNRSCGFGWKFDPQAGHQSIFHR